MKRIIPSLVVAAALATGAGVHAGKRGATVELGGLVSEAPASWRKEKPSSHMRLVQFALPRAAGDSRDAELVIFHFGARGGGSVEDNIARWKSLFEPPAGKSIDQVTSTRRFRAGDAAATAVSISGTYLYKERPLDPNLEAERRPGHRMIGVVLETKQGPYYLRLVGPARTVAKHEKAFWAWLDNLRADRSGR